MRVVRREEKLGCGYHPVRLFPGDDTPRTFENCNLVNCEVPPGSTVIKCNTTIRRTLVPTSTDEIVVDGESIGNTIYHDIIYGRYVDGVAEYKPTPEMILNETVVE